MHVIDGMIAIAGSIETVIALSERQVHEIDVDDTTSCLLRFANGVTGYLGTLHATAPFYRMQVFGTRGVRNAR